MEAADPAVVVPILGCVLERLVRANDRRGLDSPTSRFHAERAPCIRVGPYLERIATYAACSGETYILALVYMDRIIDKANIVVNSLTVHRVLLTSILLGAKYFDDQFYNNQYYAKIGGLPCEELNNLELEFLFMTNFSLHVDAVTYHKYYEELRHHPVKWSSCGCSSVSIDRGMPVLEISEDHRQLALALPHPDEEGLLAEEEPLDGGPVMMDVETEGAAGDDGGEAATGGSVGAMEEDVTGAPKGGIVYERFAVPSARAGRPW
eukprot:PLAT3435.2.p1 GENE.PLAT3435.2~~PLAT3435.2.p1  ORF type:complete len:264 (-),score=83.05 PLAT3435.2:32-823(-)